MLPGPQPTSSSRIPGASDGRMKAAASSAVRRPCWATVAGAWPCVYFSCRSGSLAMRERSSGAIEGLVTLDRHAMAVAALRIVVPHRVVLHAAVVPEGHRVDLPAEATVELRRLDVAVEELQHGITLRALELHDAGGEAPVDIERLAPGDRVRAHHRMLGLGEHLPGVVHAVAPAVDVLALVHGGQRLE